MNTPTAIPGGWHPARVIVPLAALGAILTAAGIHGYSFSAWHAAIDGSPAPEVLLHEPKGYRSDDWVVALPHALSQRAVTPAFPVENPLVGDGQYNMIVSAPAPVRDLTTLFRPQVWGYFISGDIGLAFQWWFGALGLWIAAWLLLLRLTGGDRWTSALGAAALLFSPFCQAWSLNCAPSLIFACGLLLALLRLRTFGTSGHRPPPRDGKNGRDASQPSPARRSASGRGALCRVRLLFARDLQILGAALGTAWFGVAFLLTFNYTPYLVTLLYFIVFVFIGAALQTTSASRSSGNHSDPFEAGCARVPDGAGAPSRLTEPLQQDLAPRSDRPEGRPAPQEARQDMAVDGNAPQPTRTLEGQRPISLGRLRWLGFCLAGLVILGLGAYVVGSNWETIQIVRHSDYPGQRLAAGGDQTVWHVFRGNALNLKPPPDWRYLNPCEGASFFMLFPLVFAALLRDAWRARRPPRAVWLWLAGYVVFLLFWNFMEWPAWAARWTLLERAPPSRTLIGLGLADLCLLTVYLSARRRAAPAGRADRIFPWIVSALWIGFHLAMAIRLSNYFPGYSLGTALLGSLFAMALAPLFFLAPRLVLPALVAVSVLATYDLNPLARGGTAFIRDNPLAQKILALDRAGSTPGRRPVWLAYGDMVLPNLFRMLGCRAVNGVHAYPQLAMWKALDPEGRRRAIYNRYAHVVFDLPPAGDEPAFLLQQPDLFIVGLHPAHPRFAGLGVDYLLCLDRQAEAFDRLPGLEKVFSYAGKHIYRVRQPHGRLD